MLNGQRALLSNISAVTSLEERITHRKWLLLANAEETFMRQKSRVSWLKEGDMNSTYFHRAIVTRRTRNHIYILLDDNGQKIERKKDLQQHCVDYLSSLLVYQELSNLPVNSVSVLLQFKCNEDDTIRLTSPVLNDDIKRTLFSLPHNKAPGPDGYPVEFFIGCWDFVGEDVVQAVKIIFSMDQLLRQLNATILSPVPKTVDASRIFDFRLIICCNPIYKFIYKILSKRL